MYITAGITGIFMAGTTPGSTAVMHTANRSADQVFAKPPFGAALVLYQQQHPSSCARFRGLLSKNWLSPTSF
jgi:hypothetical protein